MTTSERLYCCDAPIDLSAIEHDDGTVEVEAKVLEVGRKVQRGGAGEFEITPEHLSEMVRNHEADMARGYEPPAVVGHPTKRDEAPAVGWIKGLRAAADGLYAKVQFLKEFAQRVKAGEYRYSSPTFSFNWHDEEGRERGAKLLDLGILNNPFQKALGAFVLSEVPAPADPGADGAQLSLYTVGDDRGDTAMADANVELGELRLTTKQQATELEAKAAEITSLSEQVQTLIDERDSLTAKLSEAESDRDEAQGKVKKMTRDKEAAEINVVLHDALHEGKLAPSQVPDFKRDEYDGLKWLSESSWDSVENLKKYLKTAPRVVDLGERSSLGSGDTPDADKTRQIERAADAAMARNDQLTREQAVALAEQAYA